MYGIKMNYGEEAELICRLLVDKGASLGDTHYSRDKDYYKHKCHGLTYSQIAENLWQVEDSILYVTYKGQTRWARFIFGNSFGELMCDYSCEKYGADKLPIDELLTEVAMNYSELPFKEVCALFMRPDLQVYEPPSDDYEVEVV